MALTISAGALSSAYARPRLLLSPSLAELPTPATRENTGQVASPAQSFNSLAEALALAWAAEPRILEAENIAIASGYDVQAARTGYFPFASVSSSQADDGEVATSLRIIQPIWNGGLTRAEVDGAQSAKNAALAEVELARLEVGREVLEAYFQLLSAETQIEQWSSHVETLEGLVRVIQRRAEEGVAPEADVQTAVSRARQAEAGRETSRGLAAAQRAELVRLTGQEPGVVQWPEIASQLSLEDRSPGRDARVIERHPQQEIAKALTAQQEAEQRRQKAALWPELQLQYRVDVEGVRSTQQDGTILALEYQTGNGLRGYRAAQAEAERTRASAQRQLQARRDIMSRLRVARAELAAAFALRRSQAAAVAATDVLLDSFLRQFEVGRKSWVEVLNASREANETRQQAILAEAEFWRANGSLALESLQWARLVGETNGVPDNYSSVEPEGSAGALGVEQRAGPDTVAPHPSQPSGVIEDAPAVSDPS